MVTSREKLGLLEARLIALSRLRWDKMSDFEKKLEKSLEKFQDKQINKFIANVMKDPSILEELNQYVDRVAYPDQN